MTITFKKTKQGKTTIRGLTDSNLRLIGLALGDFADSAAETWTVRGDAFQRLADVFNFAASSTVPAAVTNEQTGDVASLFREPEGGPL